MLGELTAEAVPGKHFRLAIQNLSMETLAASFSVDGHRLSDVSHRVQPGGTYRSAVWLGGAPLQFSAALEGAEDNSGKLLPQSLGKVRRPLGWLNSINGKTVNTSFRLTLLPHGYNRWKGASTA